MKDTSLMRRYSKHPFAFKHNHSVETFHLKPFTLISHNLAPFHIESINLLAKFRWEFQVFLLKPTITDKLKMYIHISCHLPETHE